MLVLLCGGIAAIAWQGRARAVEREPVTRVVCIDVAGMAVRLARQGERARAEEAMEAANSCAVPGPRVGLPGEHLVSALLDDGSALELRRTPGEPAVIGLAAREALRRIGWKEAPSSALARARIPGLEAAAFEHPDGGERATLWVIGDGRGADPLLAVAVIGEVKP